MPAKFAARRIGIFGGTFDPVHYGHLRMALEVRNRLELDQQRLMPAGQPPHRHPPRAAAEHRWNMVQLAIREFPDLSADDREIRRAGFSYSVESIADLRAELEPGVQLALCMGWDSLVSLTSWHRWADLLNNCAIVAVGRPHHQEASKALPAELRAAVVMGDQTMQLESGTIRMLEVSPQPMSATRLRALAGAGQEWPQDWVPPAVVTYIKEHQLYGLK